MEMNNVSVQMVSCCAYKIQMFSSHLHDKSPFDYWVDPIVHLPLLKSSMPTATQSYTIAMTVNDY